MKTVELYARVRHAVMIEGISERAAADRFNINARTVSKMLKFSVPPGYVPLSPTGAELLFEVFSQRYERGSTLVTSNLPFDEWTSVFGSERLTGALLDRLTHHVHILEMNGDSFRLAHSKRRSRRARLEPSPDAAPQE